MFSKYTTLIIHMERHTQSFKPCVMLGSHRQHVWSTMGGSGLINASIIWGNLFPWGCLGLPSTACTEKHWLALQTCHSMMLISWMFVKCFKKTLRQKMLWQYRCGSPCEIKFISVVCGLAVIQKQLRLVDRAFNRASPSHFPEPAFQALLQTSASPPVSHFWLLPFPPTHSSALSLFPNPVLLTQQAALIYPLHCGCTTYLPETLTPF